MIARALPAACLFGVAATTLASWRLRWAFERIATSGSGGVGTIATLTAELMNALIVGLVCAAAVLVLAAIRRRTLGRQTWFPASAAIAGVAFLGLVVVLLSWTYYDVLAPVGVRVPWSLPRLWSPAHPTPGRLTFAHAYLLQWVTVSGLVISVLVGVATGMTAFTRTRPLPKGA